MFPLPDDHKVWNKASIISFLAPCPNSDLAGKENIAKGI